MNWRRWVCLGDQAESGQQRWTLASHLPLPDPHSSFIFLSSAALPRTNPAGPGGPLETGGTWPQRACLPSQECKGEPSLIFSVCSLFFPLLWHPQLKEDNEFQEFLSVHQKRTQVATWANDALDAEPSKGKSKADNDYLNFDSDSGQESEQEEDGENSEGEGMPPAIVRALHLPARAHE